MWQKFFKIPSDPTRSYLCETCGRSFFVKDIPTGLTMETWLTNHLLEHLESFENKINEIHKLIPHGYSN